MPSNSSLAAKKRSVNAVRKKTRKRLLKKEKHFGMEANTSIHHEKRRKLYSHQKTSSSEFISSKLAGSLKKKKTKEISTIFNTVAKNIMYETKLFMDVNAREKCLLEKVNNIRTKYTTNQRKKSTIIIIVKNRKYAVKLAPKLGWNGKNSEILRTIKTSKHKTGSLGRYVDWKGIGIIDPKTDDEEDMLVVINQCKAGQLHTLLICSNPPKTNKNNVNASGTEGSDHIEKSDDEDIVLRSLKLNNIKQKFSSVISLVAPANYGCFKERSCFVKNCHYTFLMQTKYNAEKVSLDINDYVDQITNA
eukprot:g4307.t1